MFSSEDAEQWWVANRDQIYTAYNISQQHPPPTWQQQQQGQQSPEPQAVGVTGGEGSSSAGRVLVSLATPHPLGAPAASTLTPAGLRELRVKR
jgi:hypothetical protein